jgi:FG-GAP-like repeat
MQASTICHSFALFVVCAALAQAADVCHALAEPLFKDVTAASGLAGNVTCAGASWRDFNADGRPDVLIGGHFQRPRLFKNLGSGKFLDVRTWNGRPICRPAEGPSELGETNTAGLGRTSTTMAIRT